MAGYIDEKRIRLSLPALTSELRRVAEQTKKAAPSYNTVAGRVRDAKIPAEWDGRQYWVDPSQVPTIAVMFGLIDPPSASRSRRRRAA